MPNNFYYAASCYLDEWMWTDRKLHLDLSFERQDRISPSAGADSLCVFAKSYGVMRTFNTIEEEPRLNAAYGALRETTCPIESDLVSKVENFAETLRKFYGKVPLSAASKFLWIRFRSPVIIYDSIVWKYLCDNYGLKDADGYTGYCRIWKRKFADYEEDIRAACAELKDIKTFTAASDVSDGDLEQWTSSQWFRNRVFDSYMLNAAKPWPA
jgi:hypothetical protein